MAQPKSLGTRAARQAERLFGLPGLPFAEKLKDLADRAARELERQMAQLLDPLPIATKREVARIERELGRLSRKLRMLEKDPSR